MFRHDHSGRAVSRSSFLLALALPASASAAAFTIAPPIDVDALTSKANELDQRLGGGAG